MRQESVIKTLKYTTYGLFAVAIGYAGYLFATVKPVKELQYTAIDVKRNSYTPGLDTYEILLMKDEKFVCLTAHEIVTKKDNLYYIYSRSEKRRIGVIKEW